ncbi:MAG TPA: 5-methyltetrahydropteroyltriglutamate--homocysteine S-methyltransferase, partial [Bacillales bacterium]|nr:5-methyltetrahydropteroyltriglutamate--homocysteine S-methyltransferase [Bacillales bacterium]
DFSLYDHVLDTAFMFGLIPERFRRDQGEDRLDTYFSVARGSQNAVASEMTKWFNTNYHYIVPELEASEPELAENLPLAYYREAKEKLDIAGKPVILGPVTFLKLAKGYGEGEFDTWLDKIVPLYSVVLKELQDEGVEWVQLDEPVLGLDVDDAEIARFRKVYNTLNLAAPKLNLLLQTYFESVDRYREVVDLPVQGIGLDFVHDRGANLAALKDEGFPEDKVLAAGVVDGRNIWRADLTKKRELLGAILEHVSSDRLVVQPSCSLLHVPVTTAREDGLDPVLREALAFADEKLFEVSTLVEAVNEGEEKVSDKLEESAAAVRRLNESPERNVEVVKEAAARLETERTERQSPYSERRKHHERRFRLPILPTTTIGSLPQTTEVRRARRLWRKGEWDDGRYELFVKDEIKKWIDIQEEIGLDVLIHGEFERNDMVEYFGEHLQGFAATRYAWVQ